MALPLVGVTADWRDIGDMPYHIVGDKYARAVWEQANCTPVLIPAMAGSHDPLDLVTALDGIFFTGSPSNVHPDRYGHAPSAAHEPYDRARDATIFPLIEAALDAGVPALFVCRGFQELNVALGGTLHAKVHEVPGRLDHRRPKHEDVAVQYGPKHTVRLVEKGFFAGLAGATEITVNSLHNQALDEVSDRLIVEAVAPDGTPEAVVVKDAKGFAAGVQWHPEFGPIDPAASTVIFEAFGDAVRQHVARRGQPARAAE